MIITFYVKIVDFLNRLKINILKSQTDFIVKSPKFLQNFSFRNIIKSREFTQLISRKKWGKYSM